MKPGAFILDPASFDDPEPFEWAGGRFGIRYLTPRKTREIRESVGLSPWPREGEQLSAEKEEQYIRAVLDWKIAWWEGCTDEAGEPVECNSQTRWDFVDTSAEFAERVEQWSRAVWVLRTSRARQELGNSRRSSPSDGDATPTEANATTDAAGSGTAQSDD